MNIAFALRSLRRRPAQALLCLGTLTVGIGTSVAMFAVLEAVLMRPMAVSDQDRLVRVIKHPRDERQDLPFYFRDFASLRALSGIEGAAGYHSAAPFETGLKSAGLAFPVSAAPVTTNFFTVLGARPELGRLDSPVGSGVDGAVVISRRLWIHRFGADSGVIGRRVELPFPATGVVIGVVPSGFDFPHGTDLWFLQPPPRPSRDTWDGGWFSGVLRLAPNVSLGRAQTVIQLAVTEWERNRPRGEAVADPSVSLERLLDATIGNLRRAVVILSVAVGLVLLVATGNTAALLLVRGAARGRELAIRTALGASRAEVIRLLTLESAMIAVGALILGTAAALAITRLIVLLAPANVPRVAELRLDAPALVVAIGVTFTSVLLAGLIPAIWLSRSSPMTRLRSAEVGRDALAQTRWLREGLMMVQVAMGLVVATAAGLMARTLDKLTHLDVGVDQQALTVVNLTTGMDDSDHVPQVLAFYRELIGRLTADPAIEGATPLTDPPLIGAGGNTAFYTLPGQDPTQWSHNRVVDYVFATSDYFRVMGIQVVKGVVFPNDEYRGQARQLVVNESMARLLWPGREAIGQIINFVDTVPSRVIGVVANTRYRNLTDAAPTAYVAMGSAFVPPTRLAVRSRLSPVQVEARVRRLVDDIAPAATVYGATSMVDALSGPIARPRFNTALLGAFAAIGLGLIATGLFATMSALVHQRTREIGLRVALGAGSGRVGRLMLGRGLVLAGAGVSIGLLVTLAGSRVLRALLFEVQPNDPLTLVVATMVILGIAALACLAPTLRAARIDPMITLRTE